MKIWRANTRTRKFTREDIPEPWEHLGGRGLLTRILLDEIDPACDPLGSKNKLIFAPGLLVGHMLSSCDRISVGGKSPLTGGIKESNAGGKTGLHLTQLGIKALILEDLPVESGWWVLHLSKDGIRFDSGTEFAGKGVYQVAPELIKRYGGDVAIALIGPGGETLMASSGIQNIDKDQAPSRINARGGLGAVMGSKKIKAIVIDPAGGDKPPLHDPKAFRQAQKDYNKAVLAHPQTTAYQDYGTAGMTNLCNTFGALPTRNFSSGEFEGAQKLSGEYLRDLLVKRGGSSKTAHACMKGCVIQCSNVFGDEAGKEVISPIEYETIGLMGSNLGIDSLDDIARLNWEANDLGVDTIEIGSALAVAAEAGLMEFGDGARALELMGEIRNGSPLGRVLGAGAVVTGKVFGVQRVPAVKGQAISAYEPRAIKGTGVTYATSPQGADHTCGLTIRAKVNHLDPIGQAQVSRNAQINIAGYDTLGVCIFAGFGFSTTLKTIGDLLNARYSWHVGEEILGELGRETLKLEREFNQRAGFTALDDRLPEWMQHEPLPPHNTVFDVSDADLDSVFDWISPGEG